MRGFIAALVVAFTRMITWPLNPRRRVDTRMRVREGLKEVIVVRSGGELIRFDGSTRWGCYHTWNFDLNEPDTIEWIDAIPDRACVWDIGANIGAFALYAALRRQAQVLAFEPAGSTFALLNRNIELNGVSNQVTGYCVAFAGETRLDVLNMAGTGAGLSMHGFGTEWDQFGKKIETQYRQGAIGYSVDEFVERFSPRLPTHIKIDVDGIEADILRGGFKTFSRPTVRSMIVEVQGEQNSVRIQEIFALMREMGFTPRDKAAPEYRNVVFDK